MPRFGTKTLLIVSAVVAVWLSTFTGYTFAADVRKSILLLIFIASGAAAVYSVGGWRAFWAGFFVVMLLGGGSLQNPLVRYVPDFSWPQFDWTGQQGALPLFNSQAAIEVTLGAVMRLALAAAAGTICAIIYSCKRVD